MDRIHRLGQHRPVRAIKLVIEDSIESRIVQVSLICCLPHNHYGSSRHVQLQEKKSAMIDATLSTDASVGFRSSANAKHWLTQSSIIRQWEG